MAVDPTVQTKNYEVQGGAKWVVSGELSIVVSAGAKITADGTQAGAINATVDNSGGVASDTIAAIAAGAGYTQADMVAVKNALASLSGKQNALIAALHGVGITG